MLFADFFSASCRSPVSNTPQQFISFHVVVFFFGRKTNERQLISDERRHKVIRSSPARHREFVPFLGLILVVLAMLAYYLGTTQRFTIQGTETLPLKFNHKKCFSGKGWGREIPRLLSRKQIDVSSSHFCLVIDREFGHGIVKVACGSTRLKVAVDSRGDSQGDPQTTLTMLLRH